jgi:multidrug efflux pump subunit AcrB
VWLTRFAINRPVITAMLFIVLVLAGYVSYLKLGRSNDPPGTAWPIVIVFADYPGASPQEMERLVVKPIEDQLDGIDNLDQLTATTQEGSASIGVQFKLGTDLSIAAIDVQNAVDTARVYLPVDLDPPSVYKNGASEPLLDLAISSNSLSPTGLADVVNNRLEPILKSIPNIQSVSVYGTTDREFHVEPVPGRILGTNATMLDVFNAVAANNSNLPGGILEEPTRETTVSVHAEVNEATDLLGIPLPVPGNADKALRIGDVAIAEDSHVEQRTFSHYNGQARVHVELDRNINADEIKSTQVARDRLKTIEAQFPNLTFHETDAPADYTQKSLNGVWQSLFEGILLTMIVMMLFLHAWRNAAVVMISIPTSILSTFILMNMFGFHLDSMSLMGLSLIIGILVDDSIVVLENITRHRDLGEEPMDAAINGRSEIGGAAVAITMVDVVVFLPVAFLPGIVGAFLKEFAAVIVIATLFSLFVSFTLTPLLAARWSVLQRSGAPPAWMEALKSWKVTAVLLGIAAVSYFIPWPLKELRLIIPMMIVAVLLLNAFVQNYDRVLTAYRAKWLPWGLEHGLFVVWVCAVLVANAVSLAMGAGTTTLALDGFLIALAVVWHGIGLMLRRFVDPRRLHTRELPKATYWPYFDFLILPAMFPLALATWKRSQNRLQSGERAKWFDSMAVRSHAAVMNSGKVVAGWFVNTGRGRNVTIATFALPVVLALIGGVPLLPNGQPLLGAIAFDFVPAVQNGSISMTVTYPPGTPIATTQKFVNDLEQGIMKIPNIDSVSSTVGRAQQGWGSLIGGNYAQLSAQTLPDKRKETYQIIDKIRKLAYLVPGGDLQVSGESGGGSGASIFYALSGPEDKIGPAAAKVAQFLRDTPGSVNITTSSEIAAPRLNVNIDREKAAVLGVSPADAATAARLAVAGGVATRVRTENGLVDVRVQLPPDQRYSADQLRRIRVRAQDGTLVPLGSVADFVWTSAPTQIQRLNRQRVVNVYGGVLPEYSLGAVTSPLEAKLKEPGFLPDGVSTTAQGDTQFLNETLVNMSIGLITSFLLVYGLMVILYGSFLEPLIVMCSVPLAIIGALGGLALMHRLDPTGGQSLNIISMLGVVMLFGLVAKNGILLVDYSNTLCKRGMRVKDAVLQASQTRFRPILMTTCAMVFGMLPLSLGFAEGGEWRQAMGTVIIGGLSSSLILTLFLVPMIYATWMGWIERMADRKAIAQEMKAVPTPV